MPFVRSSVLAPFVVGPGAPFVASLRREETKRGLVVAGVLGSQGGSVVGLPPGDEKRQRPEDACGMMCL